MLPSMPLLMTPMKEMNDDSSDTSDDSPQAQHTVESDGMDSGQVYNSRQHMILNCTTDITAESNNQVDPEKEAGNHFTPEKRSLSEPTSAQKKKKKSQHKKILKALSHDSDSELEASAQSYAEAYFNKVKNTVDESKWTKFVQELLFFEEKAEKQPTELYRRMEELLSPHMELIDEFLGFLLPHQALQVNRLMPYLLLVSMKEFFRKINILLMKKQVRQVLSALESLVANKNVSLAEVKDTVLPLLKSSPLLVNHFLSLLPDERPPESLMTDFEQIDFKDDSLFETIVVPDAPDPYGNENCICSCHSSQKSKHCVSCGIKYVNGRVYLQHGKSLRPANVTFNGNKHLDFLKWEESKCHSRKRFLPKTMLSPNGLDHRLNPDSEDDCNIKKTPRTPRIRVARPKLSRKEVMENKEDEECGLDGIFPLNDPNNKSTKLVSSGEAKQAQSSEHDFYDTGLDNQQNDFEDHEFDDLGAEKHDGNDDQDFDHELDDVIVDKHDGLEDHDFDDMVLDNECNTEEDEEEYEEEDLNRLHSDNDSSLEAEDITKELESGNDYSFEEEEVEDIEEPKLPKCAQNTKPSTNCGFVKSLNCVGEDSKTCKNEISSVLKTENRSNDLKVELSKSSFAQLIKIEDKLDCKTQLELVRKVNVDSLKKEPLELEINSRTEVESKHQNEKADETCNKIKVEVETENESLEKNSVEGDCSVKIECTPSSHVGEKENDTAGTESGAKEWTREEDKIILQTFQHENGLEQTFETASFQLPNRTKEEIQERFEVLLKVLKEMISDESNSNS